MGVIELADMQGYYQDVFMPEGQCARCSESAPEQYFLFNTLSGGTIYLGFCSVNCKNRFVKGIAAIHDAAQNTTQKS
jgi:hypothetical protein